MALDRLQIAERLRQVRTSLGYSQADVARALGMHRPTVSEIEAGRRAVTSEELFSFAHFYATSVSALLNDVPPTESEVVQALYRRQGLGTPEGRVALKRAIERCRVECELEGLLGLAPSETVRPGYRFREPGTKWEAVQQGERLATEERRRLGLGREPIRNPLDLLEQQGVRIVALDDDAGVDVDGIYFEMDELGACVAVNFRKDDWTGFRAAFTAAHEYAHWLLQDVRAEGFLMGETGDDGLQEVRANSFAAGFLMPDEGVRSYFVRAGLLQEKLVGHLSAGDIVLAMDHFGVSRKALVYRLQNLGLLSPDKATELRVAVLDPLKIAKRLGLQLRRQEHLSTRLAGLAIESWRRGLITAGRAAELLRIDVAAFKELMVEIGEWQESEVDEDLLGAAATPA